MSYIDEVGIVVVGGTSTDAGRIEVFNEDDNEWKKITQESFQINTQQSGLIFQESLRII